MESSVSGEVGSASACQRTRSVFPWWREEVFSWYKDVWCFHVDNYPVIDSLQFPLDFSQRWAVGLFLFSTTLKVFRKSFLPNIPFVVCMEVILLIYQQNITPTLFITQGVAQTQPVEPIFIVLDCWYYIAITITRALLGVNTVFRFSLWSIESPGCTCTWVNMMFRTQEALDHLSSVAKCIVKTENLLYCQEQRSSLCSCLIYFKNIGHTLTKDNALWLCLLRELQTRLSQSAERMQMGIPMRDRSCTAQWTEWTAAASLVLARLTICDLCHLQGLVKALIHAWATQAIWGRQLS